MWVVIDGGSVGFPLHLSLSLSLSLSHQASMLEMWHGTHRLVAGFHHLWCGFHFQWLGFIFGGMGFMDQWMDFFFGGVGGWVSLFLGWLWFLWVGGGGVGGG